MVINIWRGGRVAEGGGLLNRYTVNTVSRVRIPLPPPVFYSRKVFAGISSFAKMPLSPSKRALKVLHEDFERI